MNRIDPQNQIKLNKEIIAKLISSYGLNLINFEEVKSAGVKNTSAFLNTDKGKFVLKVYRRNNKKLKQVSEEVEFADFLRLSGIPIPKILYNLKGEFVSQSRINKLAWTYVLMEFCEGEYLDHIQYDFMPSMAKYQALMHKASVKYKKFGQFETLKDVVSSLVRYDWKAEKILRNNYLYLDIKKTISQAIADLKDNFDEINNLPSGLVHMDYESDNILVSKNKITAILDFDDLSYQPFVADIGVSFWWWLFMNRDKDIKKLMNEYLKEYQLYRKLSKKEIKYLPIFIRIRNINVMMYDLNNKKSQKEWRELLDFDVVLSSI